MTKTTDRFRDLDVLLAALCDETVHPEQITRLESLASDTDGLFYVFDYLQLDGLLRWENGSGNIEHQQNDEQFNADGNVLTPMREAPVSPARCPPSVDRPSSRPSPIHSESSPSVAFLSAPAFLPTTLHATLGLFPEGMPLAYVIATVIFGFGLLVGSVIHVAGPTEVARQSASFPSPLSPLPSVVGRITGMVDCKWGKKGLGIRDWGLEKGSGFRVQGTGAENHQFRAFQSLIPNPQSLVHLGDSFVLASGLMEITYDTGAKVILQGPVTYEIETNGGYLAVGKLTGRLEKGSGARGQRPEARNPKSPDPWSLTSDPFVIRTPTATVTDLGTEFGVEVHKGGGSEIHVLEGQVELTTRAGSSHVRLVANSDQSAVRVESGAQTIVNLHGASDRFIRAMPEAPVVDWTWNEPQGFFSVSNDDLLQTNLASITTDDPGPLPLTGQTLSALYDGSMYGPKGEGKNGDSHHSFSIRDGKSVTFVLDTRVNRQGYTIDSIDVYSGYVYWGAGQKYKVEFSQVGHDGWLPWPVVRVDRRALWDDCNSYEEARSHVHSRKQDAPLATHVGKIRFTFYDRNNQTLSTPSGNFRRESVYREIDIFGSATGSGPAPNELRSRSRQKEG